VQEVAVILEDRRSGGENDPARQIPIKYQTIEMTRTELMRRPERAERLITDAPYAPVLFADGIASFGMISGVVTLTLTTNVSIPAADQGPQTTAWREA
jgi:hypothetical protein